ncbi:hypothetical protein [Methanocella arvoryzae]|uniref:Uncharacterized protein n=1 Tax=Methanocella arvoryzae (strain DSM 22066 / NBRC 105507 / MRE50) TaxID=351160 RepID=Q0W2W3_METAR|nr:hypothetical protein [Methanocella arvoryzae]CAJ37280.1 hypothetical protein RCIX2155 [Methanocella arvoryzae MRE50]
MGDKELSPDEIQAFRQELADIKADMMRKELEEIKKERMRKELEEIRLEREMSTVQKRPAVSARAGEPQLSLPNVLLAVVCLLAAGYLIGTLHTINVTSTVDGLLTGYGLPAAGSIVILVLAVVLALFGAGMVTIAKK